LRRVFEKSNLKILNEWVSAGEDEGIIACEITATATTSF